MFLHSGDVPLTNRHYSCAKVKLHASGEHGEKYTRGGMGHKRPGFANVSFPPCPVTEPAIEPMVVFAGQALS